MARLSHLLSTPGLGLRLVQAGVGDPDLSWVSTTELLDLGAYLDGGELVLTTGLALEEDDPRWHDFVASLGRARVAAIGFGVGVAHARIPRPLVAAASAYRVALIEVPPPTPFIAVSKAVAALLEADELSAAHRALQAHRELFVGGQNPAATIATLAQATGRRIAALRADGSLLAGSSGLAGGSDPGAHAERIPLDTAGTVLVVAGDDPLSPDARALLAAGAMALGIELRSAGGEQDRERERWERLTELLLGRAGAAPADGGVASARVLDPSMRLPGQVRAIAVTGGAEALSDWRRSPRTGLERLVATDDGDGGIGGWQLCPDDEAALGTAVNAAVSAGLDAVVGRPAPLARAATSARSAAAAFAARPPLASGEAPAPRVRWVDREEPVFEAVLAGSADLAGIVAAVLGPLATAVDAEAQELRRTARVLLAHHGQRQPAAAELRIHRNTLRDRLARIEQLTGRSFGDADDRSELWFALRIEALTREPSLPPIEPTE